MLHLFRLVVNVYCMWKPLRSMGTRVSMKRFFPIENHVSFDNPKSNFPIHHLKSYGTLSNLLFNILQSFFSTFISILVAYLQRHSRWIQAIWNTVFFWDFFCQTRPLWFKLVTVCLNTATQGWHDLIWRRNKTH